ncbi:hypothetical protein G6F65_018138 [Rhizopus arrhizus]|nr:hypothetical protein G6F65_018138 [Rhizopus arrhizus]
MTARVTPHFKYCRPAFPAARAASSSCPAPRPGCIVLHRRWRGARLGPARAGRGLAWSATRSPGARRPRPACG